MTVADSAEHAKHIPKVNILLAALIIYELVVTFIAFEIETFYPNLVQIIKNSDFLWVPFFGIPFGFVLIILIVSNYRDIVNWEKRHS